MTNQAAHLFALNIISDFFVKALPFINNEQDLYAAARVVAQELGLDELTVIEIAETLAANA